MALSLLIIEDEPLVAQRLTRLSNEILGNDLAAFHVASDINAARRRLATESIDLILLDLNLAGDDGFDLLREFAAKAAHTIVVSAEAVRAIEAFDLGVLDFVAKPFTRARLEKALNRFAVPANSDARCAKQVAFETGARVETIDVDDILYFKGVDKYSEAILRNGSIKFHSKPLSRLEAILSGKFVRSHKSFLVQVAAIQSIRSLEGSRYKIDLDGCTSLPIGRTRVDDVRQLLAARDNE